MSENVLFLFCAFVWRRLYVCTTIWHDINKFHDCIKQTHKTNSIFSSLVPLFIFINTNALRRYFTNKHLQHNHHRKSLHMNCHAIVVLLVVVVVVVVVVSMNQIKTCNSLSLNLCAINNRARANARWKKKKKRFYARHVCSLAQTPAHAWIIDCVLLVNESRRKQREKKTIDRIV